ncbi:homeobox domain-containing protein [Scheffersomyces amazonensis]|uniref:homeobox domain-containing protein n=1 Tax=Scheffersomyces amazonensis TaxID=1078765 RepID=UPI00315D90E1
MMYLQTPKRSSIPSAPTPFSHPKASTATLPPLSSILSSNTRSSTSSTSPHLTTKLPSIDSFTSTPLSSKYFQSTNNSSYLPPTLPTPSTITRNKSLPYIPTASIATLNSTSSLKRNSSSAEISASESDVGSPTSSTTKTSPIPAFITPASKSSSFSSNGPTPIDTKSYAFISHSPSTYPSQEPSIDNAPLARRKRRRTSPNELAILNKEFTLGTTPNKARRLEIAARVSMTEKAVQIWFQNRRQSIRKQSNTEKEVTELPSIPIHQHPHIQHQHQQQLTVDGTTVPTTRLSVSSIPTLPLPSPDITSSILPPLISSTPTKPVITKSHSYVDSPRVPLPVSSPIKQRAQSIPNVANRVSEDADDSEAADESNSSIDDSMIIHNHQSKRITPTTLVLNETKKKQPLQLNSLTSSTMTFKLTPSITSPTATITPTTTSSTTNTTPLTTNTTPVTILQQKSSIHNILNVSDQQPQQTRKPLGQLNSKSLNKQNTVKVPEKSDSSKEENKQCAENLLSLRLAN